MSRSITILGSTGSVGRAAMDVIAHNAGLFSVECVSAHSNVALLAEQAIVCKARYAVIGDESLHQELKARLSDTDIEAASGRAAIIEAAGRPADVTLAAIVGMAGLEPILAAIAIGNNVAIANKEPMVAAGKLVMEAAQKSGATLLPVDSEHNAIFQVLENRNRDKIRRLILTASGGPFRDWTAEQMRTATKDQALAHPNWSMGNKISIDSATMMNKALEVIEAHHLFAMPPEKIDVLLHPQSIVHSMVEYEDGSVLAQMGASDMRVPITHALGWPDRLHGAAQRLDFTKLSTLTFADIDSRRFPAINLAYACLKEGQATCIAMNAANEVAVAAFLAGSIAFLDIFAIVRETVENAGSASFEDLHGILAFDQKMRDSANACILGKQHQDRKAS